MQNTCVRSDKRSENFRSRFEVPSLFAERRPERKVRASFFSRFFGSVRNGWFVGRSDNDP